VFDDGEEDLTGEISTILLFLACILLPGLDHRSIGIEELSGGRQAQHDAEGLRLFKRAAERVESVPVQMQY